MIAKHGNRARNAELSPSNAVDEPVFSARKVSKARQGRQGKAKQSRKYSYCSSTNKQVILSLQR